jgi:hypothetical protein
MKSAESSPIRCDQCGPPIELGPRGELSVRHAVPGDEAALDALYGELTPSDLTKRFFTSGKPSEQFLEGWVGVEARGGLCLLVELTTSSDCRVVAEAGFAPLADGDAELGITVAPGHRGWTGPWLLDVLMAHASEMGVENIQALVKTENRPMLDIIRHRGCARFDDKDWETTRVTMSTNGHTPTWPPESARPRILIESPRSRPDTARRAREQGGTILICGGFDQKGSHCPLHNDHRCPLIEGADAVVIDRRGLDDTDSIRNAVARVHPDANVTVVEPPSSTELPARDESLDLHVEDIGP